MRQGGWERVLAKLLSWSHIIQLRLIYISFSLFSRRIYLSQPGQVQILKTKKLSSLQLIPTLFSYFSPWFQLLLDVVFCLDLWWMSGSKGRMMCDKITSSHMCPSFYDFYLGLAERDHDFPLIEVRWPTSFINSLYFTHPFHGSYPTFKYYLIWIQHSGLLLSLCLYIGFHIQRSITLIIWH